MAICKGDFKVSLSFNALVLIPSEHCNISCRHCAPECGPTLKKAWDVPLLKKCITDACGITTLTKRVHFAGGEPFLYYPSMLELAAHAYGSGFVCSLVTNGFWSRNKKRAFAMFENLILVGLGRVELSTDIFHQEQLPIEAVRDAIEILRKLQIPITLRVVTTRKHPVSETLQRLGPDYLDGLEIVGSPVIPLGRAAVAVPEDELYLSVDGVAGCCSTLLNLTVRSDGSVYPCCAGSEENPSLSLGNLSTASIVTIVGRAELNLTIKRLIHSGPKAFYPVLEKAGLTEKMSSSYTNICHLCSSLFSDEKIVSAISIALKAEEESVIAAALRPYLMPESVSGGVFC